MKLSLSALAPLFLWALVASGMDYPDSQSPLVPDGPGYVAIPGAKVAIDPAHDYKMVIDGQNAADHPTDLVPALGRASLIINALAVGHVPPAKIKVVIVFHGPSVDGLLKNDAYHLKYGLDNPNLKVVKELAAAGVQLYVCGQYMAGRKLSMDMLSPEINLATAASIVLVTYQSEGYAVLTDK